MSHCVDVFFFPDLRQNLVDNRQSRLDTAIMGSPMLLDDNSSVSIESQFAERLKEFSSGKIESVLDIITGFKMLSATRALDIGEKLARDETNQELFREFENWDLETKLWHLAELLYEFRYSEHEGLLKEYEFSTLVIKQENYLRENPKIRELALVMGWLQSNSRTVDAPLDKIQSKWPYTSIAVKNKDFNIITHAQVDIVDSLDIDSPLRSGKQIDKKDEEEDVNNFRLIYELVLSNRISDAIEYANNTGNYSLSLILVGATQGFVNPVVDGLSLGSRDILDSSISDSKKASGMKHRILWKNTVYKLSQHPNLNKYEKLIYNYLCGGDISENLKESEDSWESHLLLYVNQLYLYLIDTFTTSKIPKDALSNESLDINIPNPQNISIEKILNSLSRSGSQIAEQSRHPLRVICGSLMINQVTSLMKDIAGDKSLSLLDQPHIIRVVTHLAIIQSIIDESKSKDITKIIAFYVSKFNEYDLNELIPIYLSFVPDEQDAREMYSKFLSSITDTQERLKQIEAAKTVSLLPQDVTDPDMNVDENPSEKRIVNVLKRTVERVIEETSDHYRPSESIEIQDSSIIDPIDFKLYRSVDWFYQNSMYEDAISATLVVISKFLLCGKISAVKEFTKDKNFKKLIKDYDFDFHTKSISNPYFQSSVTEEDKQELLEFEILINGFFLIDDWKRFLEDNKINGVVSKSSFWKSKDIENSIEKISKQITNLISNWCGELIRNSSKKVKFEELRSIYVPYFSIELLHVYQYARNNSSKYTKKAFDLVNDIANDEKLLDCFKTSGKLDEFLVKVGELSLVASEDGIDGIFS